jgi:hypothetical protein
MIQIARIGDEPMNNLTSIRGFAAAAAIAALSFAATGLNAQEASVLTGTSLLTAEAATALETSPLRATVELLGGRTLTGTLTDAELDMKTSFGTANIPLSEVAGIRFAPVNDAATTVVMLNGDSLTGTSARELMTVETEWGTAQVNVRNIASIMFMPGLDWESKAGLSGERWNLITEKKASPISRRYYRGR